MPNQKKSLPFVQQVVFQSLFHLEDEVPKVVHRHDSDVHLSVVPYLQCNNIRNKIKNYREYKWTNENENRKMAGTS